MPDSKQISLLRQMIERAQKQIDIARAMLEKLEAGESINLSRIKTDKIKFDDVVAGQTVEGVFDGISMIAGDGRSYAVPPNYASKSKLVEGDILKLTIAGDGTFLYKQIAPVERKRLRGALLQDDDTGEYSVLCQGQIYKVLTASITYFKGEIGDEVIIIVPSDKPSAWAAVENIIKQVAAHSEDENYGGELPAISEEKKSILDDVTADLL